ncbi:MAG: aminotransferase class I/II-fold pyridoxal phosphate-dependent enzyme [candidate division Zixibacteria bacterium]|nr:aminotransferase class I/II-fold pyridoxal phosphate-dependent enzyme [candidate division Zixibacteria bacterium]
MRIKISLQDKISSRMKKLGEYVFAEMVQAKRKALDSGIEVIDLSAGNPDLPPPKEIIEALKREADNPENHRHPVYEGVIELKEAISDWFYHRFNIRLDPEEEILVLIGSKEGLSHLPLAFLNQNDFAIIPNPAYPVYKRSVILAGGKVFEAPLLKENNWLPDLDKINKRILDKAKLLYLNYPNNPTGALAPKEFLEKAVRFARKNKLILCNDMAYSEITFDGEKSFSLMEISRTKEYTLEFHSFSKTYSMSGWRLGFVVGNKKLIRILRDLKTNLDSGVFHVIQKAAITALSLPPQVTNSICRTYENRRDILVPGLKSLGFDAELPKGGIFVWAKIPVRMDPYWRRRSSKRISLELLNKIGVLTTPGSGLGSAGEGYLRFSLTASEQKLREALEKMKKSKEIWGG